MKYKQELNLSIIIPHYNSPRLLDKLIESIPDRCDIQIIVVDDNSNKELDVLKHVIDKFSNRIEFYTNHTPSKGAGTCRNIGLEYVKGKWLLFADADDYFLKGMYEQVNKYFESDCDIIFFPPLSVCIDDDKPSHRHELYQRLILNYVQNPTRKNLLKLKSNPENPPWSKLIKTEMVENDHIRFEEVLYSNDIMFSAKIGYYSKKIETSQNSIYCVTRSRGSLTTYKDINAFNIRMNEYIKVGVFLKEKYSKKDFSYLHITGIGTLYRAIREKYGLKEYMLIIKTFKENGIPLITVNTFAGGHFLKRIWRTEREKLLDRKFLIR